MVCRVVHLDWEQKEKEVNRAIVGLRYDSDSGKQTSYFYLNKNVKIATDFILSSNIEKTSWIVDKCFNDDELKKYPLSDRFHQRERYQTFEIELPNDRKLLDRLPGPFQTGDYATKLRYENPWYYKSVEMSPELKEAIEVKGKADRILQDLRKTMSLRKYNRALRYFAGESVEVERDIEIKKGELDHILAKGNGLVKSLDDNNAFALNLKNEDFELYLNSENGFKVSEENISLEELKGEIWAYYDIEKPLWKTDWQKAMIRTRNQFADSDVNVCRKEKKLSALKNALSRSNKPKTKYRLAEQISRTEKAIENYYSLSIEERERRRTNLVSKLESKLTVEIAGEEVKWWEDKYDAKVSWFPLLFKLEDGTEVKELHCLYDWGEKEVNGFKIISHKTEKDLLNAVGARVREVKPFVYSNHNVAYDISQTRLAAEKEKADLMDLLIPGVNPGRDVSINAYQRAKENTGIVRFDTWRFAAMFRSWLRSNNPRGDHKLASLAGFELGKGKFEKIINYDEMRVLEVQAINGDKEAMKKLGVYAVSDVLVVKEIMEKSKFVEKVYDVWRHMPFTNLTKASFSTSFVKSRTDYEHWIRHGNQRDFGFVGVRNMKERQIVKEKRIPVIKRRQLKNVGINHLPIRGFYREVAQVYLPLELGLERFIERAYPWSKDLYEKLGSDPLEKIARLQYLKQLFMQDMAKDYYFSMNNLARVDRALRSIRSSPDKINPLTRELIRTSEGEILQASNGLDLCREYYRTVYEALPLNVKKNFRISSIRFGSSQIDLNFSERRIEFDESDQGIINFDLNDEEKDNDFEDWFLRENYDFVKVFQMNSGIEKSLRRDKQTRLRSFKSRYTKLRNHLTNLSRDAGRIIGTHKEEALDFARGNVLPENNVTSSELMASTRDYQINPRDLVYLALLQRRSERRRARFIAQYGFSPGSDNKEEFSLRNGIRNWYELVAEELIQRKTRVVEQKGDYLYLEGGDLKFDEKSLMLLIRKLKPYTVDPGNPRFVRKRKTRFNRKSKGMATSKQVELEFAEETNNPDSESIFEGIEELLAEA